MPIITITRGAFSGGPALAERVAEVLGYRCISREVLVEASRRSGIPEAKFTEVLESAPPHWWERWRESLRLHRVVLQASMLEIAQGGNMVYHGHGGQELFPGILHVLKVHLTAPIEYRVQQVREREGMDEVAARQYIDQVDRARSRRVQAVFGADWRDPSRYDLVLNIARMSPETCAHLVVEAARRPEYQPTAESERAFENLTLTARVQSALVTSPMTRNLQIDVRAERGTVHISGVLNHPDIEAEVVRLVEKVPGVKQVAADFKWLPIIEDMYP